MIKIIRLIIYWIRRLPWKFTLPFLVLLAVWLFLVAFIFQKFQVSEITDLIAKLIGIQLPDKQDLGGFTYHKVLIRVVFESLVALVIIFFAILTSYNLAAVFYRLIRSHPPRKVHVHPPASPEPGTENIFEKFMDRNEIKDLKIGLVLAGGGAKGAYQAGAMKGIYEFLEQNNVLDKVRMISGTSIGSWNSMFWLAGLIMAILGGSIMPPLQGIIIKQDMVFSMHAENVSFILPFICFVVISIYGYRTRDGLS